jgi:hypothetical protein
VSKGVTVPITDIIYQMPVFSAPKSTSWTDSAGFVCASLGRLCARCLSVSSCKYFFTTSLFRASTLLNHFSLECHVFVGVSRRDSIITVR